MSAAPAPAEKGCLEMPEVVKCRPGAGSLLRLHRSKPPPLHGTCF